MSVDARLELVPKEHLLKMLSEMIRIRLYEETIAAKYHEGKMRCPTHLSTGQESVPAVISCLLNHQDLAVSTHRSHAHYLGKGGSGKKMIAEIYGKATGCSKGKGGSMHLIDLECGFKGSTAIVGNTIPIGVGLGMALKLDRSSALSCVFVGDAACEEGVFYESANFAAVKKLPVLFACENNFYSVYSHIKVRQPEDRKIHKMVEAMGLPSAFVDSNDVVEAYLTTKEAVNRIRQGQGPQFVEYLAYRWREHCGPHFDNHIGYRTEEEFQHWISQEPLDRLNQRLRRAQMITDHEFQNLQKQAQEEVDAAFQFAEESPFPKSEDAFMHLYKE